MVKYLCLLLLCGCAFRFNPYDSSFRDNWQVHYADVDVEVGHLADSSTYILAREYWGTILFTSGCGKNTMPDAYYERVKLNVSTISDVESMIVAYKQKRVLFHQRVPTDSTQKWLVPAHSVKDGENIRIRSKWVRPQDSTFPSTTGTRP